jgi:hypothetical protein
MNAGHILERLRPGRPGDVCEYSTAPFYYDQEAGTGSSTITGILRVVLS